MKTEHNNCFTKLSGSFFVICLAILWVAWKKRGSLRKVWEKKSESFFALRQSSWWRKLSLLAELILSSKYKIFENQLISRVLDCKRDCYYFAVSDVTNSWRQEEVCLFWEVLTLKISLVKSLRPWASLVQLQPLFLNCYVVKQLS